MLITAYNIVIQLYVCVCVCVCVYPTHAFFFKIFFSVMV